MPLEQTTSDEVTPSPPRLLIVTPMHNEAPHVDRVVAGMAAQSRPPDLWLVVDDASTDGTLDRLLDLAGSAPFMRVISSPPGRHAGARDRLAAGAAATVFNAGVRAAGASRWDFIGKIDGDIELPPEYLERLMREFDADPALGIASGDLIEPAPRGGWRRTRIPPHHVPGALKLYRADCLLAIGGVPETLGWDTIDETYARMLGHRTRSFGDLVVWHHRPTGGAAGVLRGRVRHGACAWASTYPLYWVVLRAVKLTSFPPVGVAGIAFLFGFLRAAVRRQPRVQDRAFRDHLRHELRARIRPLRRRHSCVPCSST